MLRDIEPLFLKHQLEAVADHAAGRLHNPGCRRKLLQRECGAAMQSVARPPHRARWFVRDTLVAKIALVVTLEQTADHDFELAMREPVDEHVTRLDGELKAQVWIFARDDREGLRQQTTG